MTFFYSCESNDSTQINVQEALVSIIASGIIDFETDAFEVDTMYTHYDVLGIKITASYDLDSASTENMYKSVSPGNYVWSGKGITYSIDTINFEIGYDTTEVSGDFNLESGDICVVNISVIDSLKIGSTEKICSDD